MAFIAYEGKIATAAQQAGSPYCSPGKRLTGHGRLLWRTPQKRREPRPMNATPPERTPSTYAAAGVDEEREQAAFARVMRPWLARTKVRSPLVTSITGLASGYFAT